MSFRCQQAYMEVQREGEGSPAYFLSPANIHGTLKSHQTLPSKRKGTKTLLIDIAPESVQCLASNGRLETIF